MDYISRKQLKKVKNPSGFFRLKNPARAGKWVGTRVPTHDNPAYYGKQNKVDILLYGQQDIKT